MTTISEESVTNRREVRASGGRCAFKKTKAELGEGIMHAWLISNKENIILRRNSNRRRNVLHDFFVVSKRLGKRRDQHNYTNGLGFSPAPTLLLMQLLAGKVGRKRFLVSFESTLGISLAIKYVSSNL